MDRQKLLPRRSTSNTSGLLGIRLAVVLWVFAAGLCGTDSAHAQFATEYMVEMADTTKLATDVYRNPLDPTQKPAIVIRTPYGKGDSSIATAAMVLALGGYVVVVQDIRGTGKSEGEYDAFQSDGWGANQDGYDTVEWVASQTWCDGKVGMFGVSALGIAAYGAAGARPPSLECAVVGFAANDLYDQAAYQGGALRASLIDGWLGGIDATKIQLILDHPVRDAFWDPGDAEDRQPLTEIPMYHVGGWYDVFLQGSLNHFAGLQTRGGTGARGNQKLLVGPWTHVAVDTADQGELQYPSNSTLGMSELLGDALDWFDYWLKGVNNGIMDEPAARYYLMGDVDESSSQWNQWIETATWPPASMHEERLYLWGGSELRGRTPSGAAAQAESFTYDPANPVPTRGGMNLEIDAGPYDQRPVEGRPDVLLYTTDELTTSLDISGRVRVELYAASSAVDTDWTAKLCDVYPDGRSMLVCDGILQARYRESTSAPTLMTPGTVYRFRIDLWSSSLVFNKGHRIRLAISSSNSPRFEANPNNGQPVRSADPAVVATNTVCHDRARPSALILPVTRPGPGEHPLFQETETGAVRWEIFR